jgi:glycosyltransferase involved in cell wall biosynthesis
MRANAPAVTVLMPVRDAADTLADCLRSVRRQTLRDFEVLAVDDGSQDATAEMLCAHAAADSRVRVLRLTRRGLVAALNTGLAAARAPLIARMDADDLMHPRRLEAQLGFLSGHPEVDVVASRVRGFPDALLTDGYREYLRWQNQCLSPRDIIDDIYVESPLAHPSVMMRRHRVLGLGGYRAGEFPEDYDLWLRMAQAGWRIHKLPEVLLDWRDGGGRASRVDPRYGRLAFERLKAAHLARDPRLHAGRPLVIWGAGRRTRQRAGLLLAHGFSPVAWVDIDPRKLGNRLCGVPVVPPQWLARQPRPLVLCYVSNHGARDQIRGELEQMGYVRGRDFLAVA